MPSKTCTALFASFLSSAAVSATGSFPCPPLETVENVLLTTAKEDFGGHAEALQAAVNWNGERLCVSQSDATAPHFGCAEYEHGRETFSRLRTFLSSEAVRQVSSSIEHGSCFFVTASHAQAAAILENKDDFGLTSLSPFPSGLKLAPGLLEHGQIDPGAEDRSTELGRLRAKHGKSMQMPNVEGLSLELAPGVLPAHSVEGGPFINDLLGDIMSETMDLHSMNYWSDPAVVEGEHLSTPEGTVRKRDWIRAANVVHQLSEAAGTVPGDICSWNSITVHHAGDDLLFISGV
ncbi:unnamed protein product, partial [Hapterophycus canaliculatus]